MNSCRLRDSGLPGLEVETLTDITPQGYLTGTDSRLYVPQGRSKVLVRDLASRSFSVTSYSTSRSSTYHVCATDRFLFHGAVNFDQQESRTISLGALHPSSTAKRSTLAKVVPLSPVIWRIPGK